MQGTVPAPAAPAPTLTLTLASAPVPALAPAPAPAPTLLTSAQTAQLEAQLKATQILFNSTHADDWLSRQSVIAMAHIFQMDASAVTAFLVLANDEMMMCLWVLQTLGLEDST